MSAGPSKARAAQAVDMRVKKEQAARAEAQMVSTVPAAVVGGSEGTTAAPTTSDVILTAQPEAVGHALEVPVLTCVHLEPVHQADGCSRGFRIMSPVHKAPVYETGAAPITRVRLELSSSPTLAKGMGADLPTDRAVLAEKPRTVSDTEDSAKVVDRVQPMPAASDAPPLQSASDSGSARPAFELNSLATFMVNSHLPAPGMPVTAMCIIWCTQGAHMCEYLLHAGNLITLRDENHELSIMRPLPAYPHLSCLGTSAPWLSWRLSSQRGT